MGRPASSTTLARGITLDWTYVALAAAGLVLVALTTIRSEIGPDVALARSGGLHLLSPAERIVALEDDRFAAPEWAEQASDVDGLGRMLGPLSGETLDRHFPLPDGATSARLGFDLILWDSATAPVITINGAPVSPNVSQVRTLADGATLQHLAFPVAAPGDTLEVAITGQGDGQWAIDNLSLIVSLSAPNA